MKLLAWLTAFAFAVVATATTNCTVNNGGCGAHVLCVNGAGGAVCGACAPGYAHTSPGVSTGPTNAQIMGVAASYGVVAATTVTNVPPTFIYGDLALYPGTSVTGAPVVTGATHVNDATALAVKSAAQAAYTSLNGLPCLSIAAELGGHTYTPGVYCPAAAAAITTFDLTLSGQGLFVFQLPSSLTISSGRRVVLTNGARPCQVFMTVGSSATLGTTSKFSGTLIASASMTINGGATVNGSAVALTGAVTLNNNVVFASSCAALNFTGNCTATTAFCPVNATLSPCQPPTLCYNTTTGTGCTPCPENFSGNGTVGCTPINYCVTRNVTCPARSICVTTFNTTVCICDQGYILSGEVCVPADVCNGEGSAEKQSNIVITLENRCSASTYLLYDYTFGVFRAIFVYGGQTETFTVPPNYADAISVALYDRSASDKMFGECNAPARSVPAGSTILAFSVLANVTNGVCSITCDTAVAKLAANGGCAPLSQCTPTGPGNRTCGPCPEGYTGTGYTNCTQIDLCANVTCGIHSTCFSVASGPYCACDAGYAPFGLAGASAGAIRQRERDGLFTVSTPACFAIFPCSGNYTTGTIDITQQPDAVVLNNTCSTGTLTVQATADTPPFAGPSEALTYTPAGDDNLFVAVWVSTDVNQTDLECSLQSRDPVLSWTITVFGSGSQCTNITCVPRYRPARSNGGCASNAICTDTAAGNRTCNCPTGYAGTGYTAPCTDINECTTPNVTRCVHGNCTNTAGGFRCVCNAGYYAVPPLNRTCALITPCVPHNPCRHGGTCRVVTHHHHDNSTSAKCTCKRPWTGRYCTRFGSQEEEDDVDVILVAPDIPVLPGPAPPLWPVPVPPPPPPLQDACSPNPCFHGGGCVAQKDDASGLPYHCICPAGWTGIRCTQAGIREPCTDHKCVNGGLCLPSGVSDYLCSCLAPFTGAYCADKDVGAVCGSFGHCHNGGHCEPIEDIWHDDADVEDNISVFRRGWAARCVCPDGVCGGSCQRTASNCLDGESSL